MYTPLGPPPSESAESKYADFAGSIMKGLQAAYTPSLMSSKAEQARAQAQEARAKSNLFNLLSGMGGGGGSGGMGSNMSPVQAAILKGLTGIDLSAGGLQTPQEAANLAVNKSLQTEAGKKNLATGSYDVAREGLQGVVSMPESYTGALGSINMVKDRVAAQKGDKDARKRLIQAAVAERLVPEYAGFQLLSQGQRATVPALAHQTDAIRQGWPMASHTIVNNLTHEDQKEVERLHNQYVRNINRARDSYYKSGGQRSDSGGSESSSGASSGFLGANPKGDPSSNLPVFSGKDLDDTAKQHGVSDYEVVEQLARRYKVTPDQILANIRE